MRRKKNIKHSGGPEATAAFYRAAKTETGLYPKLQPAETLRELMAREHQDATIRGLLKDLIAETVNTRAALLAVLTEIRDRL